MNLKTFVAESMPAALAQVKQAFGTDAVILHTRTYKRGGILGFGAKTVVEITAARASETGHARRPRKPVAAERSAPRTAQRPAPRPAAQEPSPSMSAGELIRRTYLAAQAEAKQASGAGMPAPAVAHAGSSGGTMVAERPAFTSPSAAPAPSHAPVVTHAAPPSQPAAPPRNTPALAPLPENELTEEMRLVKRMVAKMMRQQRESATTGRGRQKTNANPDLPDKLFDQYLGLLQQEVAEELAEEVMQQVRASLSPEEMSDEAKVKKAVGAAICKHVPSDDTSISATTRDGRPRTIALIGPTGVGKTTTVAKLAANFKLREKKKVGLITIDTYRIAAVDQLRTYANIIGVPLQVVTKPEGMAEALAKTSDCDVVLIDTAGRSQRDDPKLEQLNHFIAACDPHEVHLVLSSTCTQSALFDVIERFSRTRVDRILFTKLDEAVTFGVLLNVARKVKKRLSYLTTGQEVPHDIELGRSDRLAALVLGEGL